MKNLSIIEKIEIITKIISIWGSLTNEDLGLENPICLAKYGDGKYSIIQLIEEYNLNDVTVINYSDKNALHDEKRRYDNLPEEIIDEILTIIVAYDEKKIKSL